MFEGLNNCFINLLKNENENLNKNENRLRAYHFLCF